MALAKKLYLLYHAYMKYRNSTIQMLNPSKLFNDIWRFYGDFVNPGLSKVNGLTYNFVKAFVSD